MDVLKILEELAQGVINSAKSGVDVRIQKNEGLGEDCKITIKGDAAAVMFRTEMLVEHVLHNASNGNKQLALDLLREMESAVKESIKGW